MRQALKYQDLIDRENLTVPCPDMAVFESSKPVFRWCNEPIEHEHNFLPNRQVDQLKKKKRRKLKGGEPECCEYCAVSFFDSLNQAKDRFMGFPEGVRELLGYTHIATGGVEQSDGLMSDSDEDGHFNFFEYCDITVQFQDKFSIVYQF